VKNVVQVSINRISEISELTTAVGTLQTSVDALLEVSGVQSRRITKLKTCQKEADMLSSNDNSSDDETLPQSMNLALGRVKLATKK
jgi:hypothetical protein